MAKPDTTVKDVLPEYRATADANPTSIEAQTNLGWGLYGTGQYEEAIRQFEKAIGLNGNFFDAHYGLALACKKAGRNGQAIGEFEKASGLLAGVEDKNRTQLMTQIIQTHLNTLRSRS